MSSHLEQFIRDHRDAFDSEEPGKKVWGQIEEQTVPGRTATQPVVWISRRRWSAAAAVSLLIAGTVWYFTHGSTLKEARDSRQTVVQGAQGAHATGSAGSTGTTGTVPTGTGTAGKQQRPDSLAANTTKPAAAGGETSTERGTGETAGTGETGTGEPAGTETPTEADFRKEMGYYAKLVELKHKELQSIEKDEPLLYKQFAWDVKRLDSVYRVLENQLPQNPNREQLLEAMSQNLQLQMGLLNHQLGIIKQINHSKKTAYEKAYKTT